MVSVYDHMAEANHHLRKACENLSSFAKVCKLEQIMLTMKCTIHPLVQLVGSHSIWWTDPTAMKEGTPRWPRWVRLTMIPNHEATSIKSEKDYSVTRILATVVLYKLQQHFISGTTQVSVMAKFHVCPKPLFLCITSKQYFGGSNKKAAEKRKSEEDKQKKRKLKLKSCSSSMAIMQLDDDNQPSVSCETVKECPL